VQPVDDGTTLSQEEQDEQARRRNCDAGEFLLEIVSCLPTSAQQLFSFTATVEQKCRQCGTGTSTGPRAPDTLHYLRLGSQDRNVTATFAELVQSAIRDYAVSVAVPRGEPLCTCGAEIQVIAMFPA
jgi:hypothetical protein